MLDSYSALEVWSFKIIMHGEYLGEYLIEKPCSWKPENKVNLNDSMNFILKHIC